MKNNYRPVPFVRLFIPLALGILVGVFQSIPLLDHLFWICWPILLILSLKKTGRTSLGFGVMLFVLMFALGHWLVNQQQPQNDVQHFMHSIEIDSMVVWKGVMDAPSISEKSIAATVHIHAIQNGDNWEIASGKVLARFKKDQISHALEFGDELIASSQLKNHSSPKNPKAFDYGWYLTQQGIHHQTYVNEGHAFVLKKEQGHPLWTWCHDFRLEALEILKTHLTTDNEMAVGSALILGYKEKMTEEVQKAYSQTGATHVLAVSGLHVGILYLIVHFFFSFYQIKNHYLQVLRLAISLVVIWGFAFLTGASPSVLRAATMFSFVAVGDVLNREKSIYNTLAASAFVLLCCNPYLLFNPGFQLSYLAVIGIVFFQPIIYKSWYVKSKIGSYLWTLMSVSIAAQIMTAPISLYYFHQFPTYFLLSGLVVIPAASLIMGLGLSLMILSQIPFLDIVVPFVGLGLYGVIWLVNSIIFLIGQLPFNHISNVHISLLEMLMCYVAIGLLMYGLSTDKKKYFIYALSAMTCIVAYHTVERIVAKDKDEIIIYSTKGILMDYHQNGWRSTFKSEGVDDKTALFAAQNYRIAENNSHENGHSLYYEHPFLQMGHQRFFILDKNYYDLSSEAYIEVDGILIQNNPFINFAALESEFGFEYFVADGSNKKGKVKKWREILEDSGKELYHTPEHPIFVKN